MTTMFPLRPLLCAAMVLLVQSPLATHSSHAATAEKSPPPPLAKVHTWGELQAVKPVSVNLPDGQKAEFLLGIDHTRCSPYSGVVLYCLQVNATGADPRDLGPFVVSVHERGVMELAQAVMICGRLSPAPARDSHDFWMKTVPVGKAGDYVIDIKRVRDRTDKGEVVASATVQVSGAVTNRWSPWNQTNTAAIENIGLPKGGVEGYSLLTVENPKTGLAIPSWEGIEPEEIAGALPEAKTPLPQLFPGEPDPGIKTELSGNELVVTLDRDISIYYPNDKFLTRWWVNGKSYAPNTEPGPMRVEELAAAEAVVHEARFHIAFNPKALGAKKGDKISVQLLFCPHGWECAAEDALKQNMARQAAALKEIKQPPVEIARLSNRVDFTYSGDPEGMQQLAKVSTWGDLLATNPVFVRPGDRTGAGPANDKIAAFHVGIDSTNCARGGAVVLYCVTNGTDAEYPVNDLGPFHVDVTTPKTRPGGAGKEGNFSSPVKGNAVCYMSTIPLNELGDNIIQLRKDIGGDVVESVTIHVPEKYDSPWTPWASPMGLNGEQYHYDHDKEPDCTMEVTNAAHGMALPYAHGDEPIALEAMPGEKLPLPRIVPGAPDPGVQLAVRGSNVLITLTGKNNSVFYIPDERFLTRWWVNGKPFQPQRGSRDIEGRAWDGPGQWIKQMCFHMQFHPELLGAKKGDKIGLQVLLCKEGWDIIDPDLAEAKAKLEQKEELVPAEDMYLSKLSNRVEFVYDGKQSAESK